jgi:hypothetical protein
VPDAAPPSKKAQKLITGLLMASSIVFLAEYPSTGSSYQLQLMKLFTWASEIHSQVEQNQIF